MSGHASRDAGAGVADRDSGYGEVGPGWGFEAAGGHHDDHEHANDHYALVYETEEELFSAVVPFVREGLAADEHCLYVLDDRSEATVADALREGGVDVEAARERDALSFLTVEETYLREEPFDPETMVDFYADAVESALEEHAGLRVVAGTNWIADVSVPDFMDYEGRVNRLFDRTDSAALCLYDRTTLPASVIEDVIRTHPHVVFDGTVCENFYYVPPDQIFDDDGAASEVDRLLGTLRDRTRAEASLADHERFLRRMTEITASPELAFEEKLQGLFDLGCARFGMDLGGLNKVDPDADRFEVEYLSDPHEGFESGEALPLSETYCQAAAAIRGPTAVDDPAEVGYDDITVVEEFGVKSYIGTYVPVEGGTDRTFGFLAEEPREVSFSEEEVTCLELMGQWVKYELDRRARERFQRQLYEIAADTERAFEEKLQAVFDLGCERFDAEVGGLAYVDPAADRFEVEATNTDHDDLEPGRCYPLSETYCRAVCDEREAVSVTDPESDDGGRLRNDRFGVRAYIGTYLDVEGDRDRTFWFVSTETPTRPYTDADETCLHLMGQWVKYELERRAYERDLAMSERRYRTLAEHFPNGAVAIYDDDLRYTLAEGQALGETLPTADRLEGDRMPAIFPQRTAADLEPMFRAAVEDAETGCTTTEFDGRVWKVWATPLHDADGEVFAGLSFAQDVTEQVERERQLEASNDRLKQFAYAASHDLQEPLRMVSSYLQLIEKEHAANLDPEAEEFLEYAVDGADRMRAMVEDLLAYSRIEQGDLTFEPVDVEAVVDRVTDDLRVQIDEADASVDVEALPTVRADPDQLEQLFRNLLSNAIKYGGESPPEVEVTVEERTDRWTFAVADDGIGIDPDKIDRIFEVFKRLHHDDEYAGTGIGLSLCQEIVDNHGGGIGVDSVPGEGSTFHFTIPKRH